MKLVWNLLVILCSKLWIVDVEVKEDGNRGEIYKKNTIKKPFDYHWYATLITKRCKIEWFISYSL